MTHEQLQSPFNLHLQCLTHMSEINSLVVSLGELDNSALPELESVAHALHYLLLKTDCYISMQAHNLRIQNSALNTISRWENNSDTPNMIKLHMLAEALNVQESDLISPHKNQKWILQIKLADNKSEEITDMTKDMPCVAAITGNPYGADFHISGNWEILMDDDKFMDLIDQIMETRSAVLQLRKSMSKVWRDKS